ARSGFLPARHQGVSIDDSLTDPQKMIRFLRNDKFDLTAQRRQLDFVQQANREHERSFGDDEFLEGRIAAMESAFRMQAEATDAFDIRNEPESVRQEYGATPFANGCLLARRLLDRGLRTVHGVHAPGKP